MDVWIIPTGNTISILNALTFLGCSASVVETPDDIYHAGALILPGMGSYQSILHRLKKSGFLNPLRIYIKENRPLLAIGIGLHALAEGSAEYPQAEALNVLPLKITKFSNKHIPHTGWNICFGCHSWLPHDQRYYFSHSYAIPFNEHTAQALTSWNFALTRYKDEVFVSAIARGKIIATQFYPEKSGELGLKLLKEFYERSVPINQPSAPIIPPENVQVSRRVVACLDIRHEGERGLFVNKGDHYTALDVSIGHMSCKVGPVDLAIHYYHDDVDEIVFLNLIDLDECPIHNLPMLQVLKETAKTVFIPLVIGGGIRDIQQPGGVVVKAVDVAARYFQSGADKVTLGTAAVYAAEKYYANGMKLTKKTTIEQISATYGGQSVIISVDPKRAYVHDPSSVKNHSVIETELPGPNGEKYCWFQCTIKGGKEARDLDVVQLVTACEKMGAGEILLNSIDMDGLHMGYDDELIQLVKKHTQLPIIASCGPKNMSDFASVFKKCDIHATLASGIFHRDEITIPALKSYLKEASVIIR